MEELSTTGGPLVSRLVAVLLALQVVSVAAVWSLGTVGQESANLFALFTAVSLVSFALVSYLYRVDKREGRASTGYLLAGLGLVFVLLLVTLFA